jgi:hypothetical protein
MDIRKNMFDHSIFGQGASLLAHHSGKLMDTAARESQGINAFYDLMPEWFIVPGVVIATSAAIIASQAMVSGSFTLINEAVRLNLWPKMKINYPTEAKGQIFIPGINTLLFVGCVGVVFTSGSCKNGSCLWIGHHHYYDHDHDTVCQLHGIAPGQPRAYLCFLIGLFCDRSVLLNCINGQICSRRLYHFDDRFCNVLCNVHLVPVA